MQNRLKINIIMPFYLWNNDIDRVSLTHKILVHYNNIKDKYNTKIEFKFYFIGSENELSKSIIDKYFNDSYYEFEQHGLLESTTVEKVAMLGEKVRFAVKLGTSTDYDIVMVAGSNDFISDSFFLNVLNTYNENVPQIYGIGDYYDGKNIVGIIPYKCGMNINLTSADNIWWKGYSNCQYHVPGKDYWSNTIGVIGKLNNEFTGGVICANKKVMNELDVVKRIDFSERSFEIHCKQFIKNLHVVTTKNLVNLNVKCISGADLHDISVVNQVLYLLDTLDISEMDTLLERTLNAHIEYFNNL
jgi:hypothetical protein